MALIFLTALVSISVMVVQFRSQSRKNFRIKVSPKCKSNFLFGGLINFLLSSLLLLSGDIERNPGPGTYWKIHERCFVLDKNPKLLHLVCGKIANKQHQFKT